MKALTMALSGPGIEGLGWALIHCLWQGLIIAAVLAVALRLLRKQSARARSLACWLGLLGLAACVPLTAGDASPEMRC